ncbi:MAG: hypothetical protein Q8W45_04370 [Candidatus Palauibacterales bacterium]|nr:hypothetical protein [Candidatus Palauibacterales bacterium]MDP2482498.1 hypothetical protein [Candidatus Palauibacterales bacterium]
MNATRRTLAGFLFAATTLVAGGCSDDASTGPQVGTLEVNLIMDGTDRDTNGGTLIFDGEVVGPLVANVRTTIDSVEPGIYVISVTGIESNCSLVGDNPRNVTVRAGQVSTEEFRYLCESTGGKDPGDPAVP